jgi:hypothetical protein
MPEQGAERKELLSPELDICVGPYASAESLEQLSSRMHLELAELERRRRAIAERMRIIRNVVAGLAALFESGHSR